MPSSPLVLLLNGSLRAASSNHAVLRTAAAVAPSPIRTLAYDGLDSLPHFNPDDDTDPPPPAVARLRGAIDRADALLVCTPEYAGTLPGSFKNLLDWTVGGTEINDKPVAWINAANPGRGTGAEATLRSVLAYTGAAIIEHACAAVPASNLPRDAEGVITDDAARRQIAAALERLTAPR